jgi:hypothetical protein
MQIVWNAEAVNKLKNSHTVLELETFPVNGELVTTWCVVPAEKIGLNGLSNLVELKELHSTLITAWKDKNHKLCQDIIPHLKGKFGGELDSFYQILLEKIENEAIVSSRS